MIFSGSPSATGETHGGGVGDISGEGGTTAGGPTGVIPCNSAAGRGSAGSSIDAGQGGSGF